VIFSSNIIKTPKSSRDRAEEKRAREKGKRKALTVSSNKGKVNILRGERHCNFKSSFRCDLISPPPSYHFKNPFQNH
jgi:hypothetical protein